MLQLRDNPIEVESLTSKRGKDGMVRVVLLRITADAELVRQLAEARFIESDQRAWREIMADYRREYDAYKAIYDDMLAKQLADYNARVAKADEGGLPHPPTPQAPKWDGPEHPTSSESIRVIGSLKGEAIRFVVHEPGDPDDKRVSIVGDIRGAKASVVGDQVEITLRVKTIALVGDALKAADRCIEDGSGLAATHPQLELPLGAAAE